MDERCCLVMVWLTWLGLLLALLIRLRPGVVGGLAVLAVGAVAQANSS